MPRLSRVLLAAVIAAGCHAGKPEPHRPVILLVVLDTVRSDAVSAYGGVQATTPFIDALARDGLLYRNAFSNAPWTLPSHATLFTGVLPARHGIGIRTWSAPEGLRTIAGALAESGYRTAGFSENPLVGPLTNLDQGFSTFETFHKDATGQDALPATVRRWLVDVGDEPFFLFVNLSDAHSPYEVRDRNRFLPAGVDESRARQIRQETMPPPFCNREPGRDEVAILRGLYLGDVAAADRKLADIHAAVRRAAGARDVITIVTSDHGESFGEQDRLGHLFSVGNQLLRIPLVVSGLPGMRSSVIEAPVQLCEIAAALLAWAGVPGEGFGSNALPLQEPMRPDEAIRAQYQDPAALAASSAERLFQLIAERSNELREGCGPGDRVFGGMEAVISLPYKAVSWERHPPTLYDLATDPSEVNDLAAVHPEIVAELLKPAEGPAR